MTRVTCDLSVSLDGFAAGPHQTRERPFGDVIGTGEVLHTWLLEHAEDHPDEVAGILEADAYVMGRGMFCPDPGPWDPDWTGWWGDEPPYHAPVFVLTHHPREPLVMAGGTTFHFVTTGAEDALRRAVEAAGDGDVSIAGGVSTVNTYLAAGAIDELRLHVAPVVLDIPGGTRLFDGVGRLDLDAVSARHAGEVTHLVYRRRAD
ncbi:dihydrofolate reductase family protein [Isoptericola sp. 178]|uniref:dihydrofolate reductase family protein n=1 Tax=Isoptericola sp. 178 TaxID=3064651 RepID=UPI0027139AEC|nr:dihydrofolate reductase family protein [Isoptericola sp. 178]MDO8145106.1 dihydrofolate reductase family protein [Isoptericola sp. 178]